MPRKYEPFMDIPPIEERRKMANIRNRQEVNDRALVSAINSLVSEQELPDDAKRNRNERIAGFVRKLRDTGIVSDQSEIGIKLFAIENLLSGDYIFKDLEIVRAFVREMTEWLDFRRWEQQATLQSYWR